MKVTKSETLLNLVKHSNGHLMKALWEYEPNITGEELRILNNRYNHAPKRDKNKLYTDMTSVMIYEFEKSLRTEQLILDIKIINSAQRFVTFQKYLNESIGEADFMILEFSKNPSNSEKRLFENILADRFNKWFADAVQKVSYESCKTNPYLSILSDLHKYMYAISPEYQELHLAQAIQ